MTIIRPIRTASPARRPLGWMLAIGLAFTGASYNQALAKSYNALPAMEEPCDCDVVVIRVGKAYPLELPRAARDVLISDPAIVDVVLRTARQPVLFGSKIGQANILFFDEENNKIRAVEIRVEYDAPSLNNLIRRQFPNAQVRAESSLGEVILNGTVASSAEADAIEKMAQRFVASARASRQTGGDAPEVNPKATGVVNRIAVLNSEQVHLKVHIAEINRSVLKQLGVDWQAGMEALTLGFGGGELGNLFKISQSSFAFGPSALSTFIKALEQYTLVRTLAEPNLTAVTGEKASFLAGGEFPIPVPDGNGGTAIEYKKFGVGLEFTPVVLGDGRISLQIATEVSALSTEGAIVLDSISIPSLTVRRANTTVEVSSGGALMIAGLIEQDTRRLSSGLPGLRSLPVLGQFFRSEQVDQSETELVILVTPYTVTPNAPSHFALPTDGFLPSGDMDSFLFGRLHTVYGGQTPSHQSARAEMKSVGAPIGYIME